MSSPSDLSHKSIVLTRFDASNLVAGDVVAIVSGRRSGKLTALDTLQTNWPGPSISVKRDSNSVDAYSRWHGPLPRQLDQIYRGLVTMMSGNNATTTNECPTLLLLDEFVCEWNDASHQKAFKHFVARTRSLPLVIAFSVLFDLPYRHHQRWVEDLTSVANITMLRYEYIQTAPLNLRTFFRHTWFPWMEKNSTMIALFQHVCRNMTFLVTTKNQQDNQYWNATAAAAAY